MTPTSDYSVGGYMKTLNGPNCIEYVTGSSDAVLRILNSIFISNPLSSPIYAIATPIGEPKTNITLAHSIGNQNPFTNDVVSATHPSYSIVYVFDALVQ